jgi:hypothetical protein
LVCQTARVFCQNYMDAKLVCQTVGVALTSSYSKRNNETIKYNVEKHNKNFIECYTTLNDELYKI